MRNLLLVFGCAAAVLAVAEEAEKPEDLAFKGMKYRSIGPFRGGRSLSASGIPGDALTYYFGSTGGGVWKSKDGALTWSPMFDKEGTGSVGAIAVSVADPNVIYAGTGEACLRGNISHGDGVYKSLDGGKTWKNMGLRDSRAIGKIIVDPRDAKVVFVAALGHQFGPNAERGVFRSIDGGKTWEKVLYKDDKTGAVDIAFDPRNPNILFAALWQVFRTPYSLESGGPGSGLYRSADGGSTWKKIEDSGLPKEPYGKIGVAVGANSDRIFVLIEAAEGGGLYRSDDGGEKWRLVNASRALWQRGWYYMHAIADPKNADVLYVMNVEFLKSTDGGRSFNKIKVPHGDNHGLWIDPENTQRMITADDGGAAVTLDGGAHWTREDNQPTAQFYHVITDQRFPYFVYGAQQDNSTIAIASRTDRGAIDRPDWYSVGGGEAGYIAPYPNDPEIVYAGDYEGTLTRFDKHTGQVKSIAPWPELTDGLGAANLEHRFQWTAPLLISPHDPDVLYHGGERLFKSTNGGMSWEAISGDLTRNDKSKQGISGGPIMKDDTGTEYYDTIFAVAESPVTKGVIWAGTDDGLIQITRDGGKTWSNVTPKQMPEWSRISQIDASTRDAGTAYAAVDRHQNDDLRPYIYKTSDFGGSWIKLGNGIPEGAFVRAVRADPKRAGVLYAGTETGVYVSFNDGADWRPLKLNLPTVPVHDLVVKDDDLVLATHGRAFWILDDLSALRQYDDKFGKATMHLYTPGVALRTGAAGGEKSPITGENPQAGALIYFSLGAKPKGENWKNVSIEILDAKGALVRKYSSEKSKPLDEPLDPDAEKPKKEIEPAAGLNRFAWDLHYEEVTRVPGYYLYDYQGGAAGPVALPGSYQVRVTAEGESQTAPLEVKLDPRVHVSREDLEKQFALSMQIREELNRLYNAVNQMADVRAQVRGLGERSPRFRAAGDTLDPKIATVMDGLIDLKISANEDSCAFPIGLDGKLAVLAAGVAGGSDSAPTEASYRVFEKLKRQLDQQIAAWAAIRATDLGALDKIVVKESTP